MTKMELLNSGLVIAVAGASLAAFFAGLGYLLRQYNEQRRIARKALFNMLSLWEVVFSLCNPPDEAVEAAFAEYRNAVSELLGPASEHVNWNHPFLTELVQPLLIEMLSRLRPGVSDGLKANYMQSVEMLSERYPLLAFRLTNNHRLGDLISSIEEYETRTKALLCGGELAAPVDAIQSGQQLTRKYVSAELVESLQQDVLRVAWKAGTVQWLRCWMLFRRGREAMPFPKATRQELRNAFKLILQQWLPQVVGTTISKPAQPEEGSVKL